MTRSFRSWRRLAEVIQALLMIGIPFIFIGGESALRFDVPTLRLHFFGISLWMEEFFIVLIAIIFFSFLIIFVTLLFGRIWCGWLCPQTVLCDFSSFVEKAVKKGLLFRLVSIPLVLLISLLVSANLIWYFVSPYDFFEILLSGSMHRVVWGSWIALTLLMFLNFMFLRQRFCATVCPYSKLQSTLFDDSTLAVAFDRRREDECIDCMACLKNCPVRIDIREGLDAACIHCAECIDSCAKIMGARKKHSLIGYFFGSPGEGVTFMRKNVLLFGTLTALFLIFFIFLLFSRTALDMTVLPNNAFTPKTGTKGTVVNSYILSLKNRGREDIRLRIRVDGMDGIVKIVPDRELRLKAGEMKKIPLYVYAEGTGTGANMRRIDILAEDLERSGQFIGRSANFMIGVNQ